MRINNLFYIVTLVLFSISLHGQKATDLLLEWQQYPTGSIPGIRLETSLSDKSSFLVKVGYNTFNHKDLGVHDGEEGDGFGFTLGYKRYFKPERKGWSLALKSDVWFNNVDWFDVAPNDVITGGETKITVLQPTAELAHTFVFGDNFILVPHVAFGFEWNVNTDGEPTGEGAILLGGIGIGKRF